MGLLEDIVIRLPRPIKPSDTVDLTSIDWLLCRNKLNRIPRHDTARDHNPRVPSTKSIVNSKLFYKGLTFLNALSRLQ